MLLRNFTLISCCLVIVNAGICDVQRNVKAELYEHGYCDGAKMSISASINNWDCDKCYNINQELNDKVSAWKSISKNSYLWLYEHGDCQGKSIRMAANEGTCNTAALFDFNDIASSYRLTYRPG